MKFYNNIENCGTLIEDSIKKFATVNGELKTHWEGSAATNFFKKQEEVKSRLNNIKSQVALLLVVGKLAKELETKVDELELKLKTKSGLTEPDAKLESEIVELTKDKEALINRIKQYLNDITNIELYILSFDFNSRFKLNINNSGNLSQLTKSTTNVNTGSSETSTIKDSSEKRMKTSEKNDDKKEISSANTSNNNSSHNQTSTDSLTFTNYTITNYNGGNHKGMDFAVPEGTPIQSTVPGKVVTVKTLYDGNGNYRSYGKYVVIKDNDGNNHYYAHLSGFNCEVGDTVERGTVIGYSGNTGNSTGPHLHYEVRTGDDYNNQIDPQKYLA